MADAELMLLDAGAAPALDQIEWQLLFDQVLDGKETCVVDQLYWHAATQRQTAQVCAISQPGVYRAHQQALRKLRRALRRQCGRIDSQDCFPAFGPAILARLSRYVHSFRPS